MKKSEHILYPLDGMEELARKIQSLLGDYHSKSLRPIDFFGGSFVARVVEFQEASDSIMKKGGTEVLPDVQRILAQVEALLDGEDRAIAERIRPILSKARQWARYPANPLDYVELSTSLTRLAGHLSVRAVARPMIFVGYRYTAEDEILAKKFFELFYLENFVCLSGKTAKAEDIDEKVKGFIEQSEGVIIIFTKETELKEGGWTTSTWLTDEKAFAMGKDKPILLFFEDCIAHTGRKGIHGELEYVDFNREHLEDAFLKGIPYLRDFRQRVLEVRHK